MTHNPFGPDISTKPETKKVPLGAGSEACLQFLRSVFLNAVDAVAISVLGFGSPGKGRRILARSELGGSEDDVVVGTSGGLASGEGCVLEVDVAACCSLLLRDRRGRFMYPGGNRGFSGSGLDLILRKFFTFAICSCQSALWLAQNEDTVAVGQRAVCNRETLIERTGRTTQAT